MHDFLVLMDPVIIFIYLRTTDIHFCDQRNGHHPTSKLLECGLAQTYIPFGTLFCGFLLPGKHLLLFDEKHKFSFIL